MKYYESNYNKKTKEHLIRFNNSEFRPTYIKNDKMGIDYKRRYCVSDKGDVCLFAVDYKDIRPVLQPMLGADGDIYYLLKPNDSKTGKMKPEGNLEPLSAILHMSAWTSVWGDDTDDKIAEIIKNIRKEIMSNGETYNELQ